MLRDKRVWVGGVVSIVFLALLFGETDFARLGAALGRAQYGYIIPAALLYFPGVWCRAARWQVVLAPIRQLSVGRLYPIVVIGYMVNDLVPLRAGELARSYLLHRRDGINPASVLATIGVERVSDGLTLVLFAAVASLWIPLPPDSPVRDLLVSMSGVFFAGFAVAIVVTMREDLTRWLLEAVVQRPPRAVGSLVGTLLGRSLEGLRALRRPDRIAVLLAWAALAWLSELAVFYVVGLAFELGQPLTVLALAMAASNLATSLPSSQAGIGPFEFFCAQTLINFGADPGIATAYTIVLHAVLILPVVLAGFFHLWYEQLGLSTVLTHPVRPTQEVS